MIAPETIALVKERTDLVSLIGESVRLSRKGRTFTGCCPFHKEKTPSFHVNPERGFYHCFGCKESGSGVDFVMKTHGLTFPEAVRMLAERAGVAITETTTDAEQREANAARRTKEDLYGVNHLAATYFERNLRTHPLAGYARAELERRGLPLSDEPGGPAGVDPIADTLQAFRIGYAPHAWDGLAAFLRQNGISPIVAEKVGLLVPRSSGTGHYDRFRHRLMFAVLDVMGRVVAFSGRALAEPTPEEAARHGAGAPRAPTDSDHASPAKYINSPESPIYTKGEHLFGLHQARNDVRQKGEAVLVEGNFDVVALHARGIQNVVAPLGTAFTPAQAKLLKRFAQSAVLLFDGDAAGKKATRAARGPCREGGLNAKVASLPRGIDPDDLARTQGPEAVRRVIDGATGLLEYLIDDALESGMFGGASLAEQLARVRAVAAILAEEDDPNLRSMAKFYADRVSSKMLVGGAAPASLHELERMIERATSRHGGEPTRTDAYVFGGFKATAEQGPRARSRGDAAAVASEILGALLDFPDLLDDPDALVTIGEMDGEMALSVAAMRRGKGLDADGFLAMFPESVRGFAAQRWASPVFLTLEEAKWGLLENGKKLHRAALSRENDEQVQRMKRTTMSAEEEDAILRECERRMRERLAR